MKATIKGRTHHNREGIEDREFTVNVEFTLVEPRTEHYYGTGCYMLVEFESGNEDYVDVRYEGTTDLEKLARKWIKAYYGENAEKVTFER